MRNVVVTGLGFTTCVGLDAATVTDHLKHLRHGIVMYPPFVARNFPVKIAAALEGFNTESNEPEDWVFPASIKLKLEVLRGLAPHGVYAYHAFQQAMLDSGLDADAISNPRTGLYTASAGSPARIYYNLDRLHKVGPQRCPPLGIVSSIAGTLTFNLAATYHIKGSSVGFVSACASSGHALGAAWDEIALGRQDRMFVVGAEDLSIETIIPFVSMRVLTTSSNPDTASRPFDKKRDGFVGTGGSVVMVLEEESIARARGAKIYAKLLGWGQATDGHHVAASHPEGDGLARAIRIALENTKVSTKEIDYINAHATSTQHGDQSELRALKTVFGTDGKGPAVSSTKALTGHGLSLSSIMEAAFCCLAIKEGFTPGSAHITEMDPEARGVNIIQESRETGPRTVLSNSSGFGGANVALLFQAL
ncbi:MAG: beta-ketoacyl-[acyl-carrier-protein] synthase family protein [Verrucomicrobiota bacterium]|nr:beta-ketoacyl-[acyl-carrier-protein] synthase family protein [Verrucomicrobiota bacterium]